MLREIDCKMRCGIAKVQLQCGGCKSLLRVPKISQAIEYVNEESKENKDLLG